MMTQILLDRGLGAAGVAIATAPVKGIFERYAVPGPDHVLFQAAFANFNPHATTTVNFHNDTRAPLLMISGGNDHVSPPSVVEANYHLYRKSKAITEYRDFPGRTHYTLGQDGWDAVADYALEWAIGHAAGKSQDKSMSAADSAAAAGR